MFGEFLSSAIKIVTLPVDAASAATDIVVGGDGSKDSRISLPITGDIERLRDAIADAAEDIDR